MAETLEDRPFVPAGERLARVETHVCEIRADMEEIKEKLNGLMAHQLTQAVYVRIGKAVLMLANGLAIAMGGAWFSRHWP